LPTIDIFENAWQYAKGEEIEKKWIDFFEDRKSNKDMKERVRELQMREAGRFLQPSTPIENPVIPPMSTEDWLDMTGQHDILDALGRQTVSPEPQITSHEDMQNRVQEMAREREETVADVAGNESYEPRDDMNENVREDVMETVADFDIPENSPPPQTTKPEDLVVESESEQDNETEMVAAYRYNSSTDDLEEMTHGTEWYGGMPIETAREFHGEKGTLTTLDDGTQEFYFGILPDDEKLKSENWSVVENPFANPFSDTSAFAIRKDLPRGFVNPSPSLTEEIQIEKEQKPPEIDGFKTTEGDDLSLLPASVFNKNDAPIADNMSLLPSGWKDE